MGPELMQHMRQQAERFGAVYETDDVTHVELSDDPFASPHVVEASGERKLARAVIVATGATARQLGVEGERQLQGRGVSYCAVCDAAFFRERRVVIVGGGDSAMEEATLPGQVRRRGHDRAPPAPSCGRRRSCRSAPATTPRSAGS